MVRCLCARWQTKIFEVSWPPKGRALILMDSRQGRGKFIFPRKLEREAFRTATGELGWTREHIPLVVDVIRSHGMGILGGELWWIHGQPPRWDLHISLLAHQQFTCGLRTASLRNRGWTMCSRIDKNDTVGLSVFSPEHRREPTFPDTHNPTWIRSRCV